MPRRAFAAGAGHAAPARVALAGRLMAPDCLRLRASILARSVCARGSAAQRAPWPPHGRRRRMLAGVSREGATKRS